MTTTRTLTALVSGALILVPGAALAQTGSTEQSTTQEDRVGAILGTLFGDRLGASTSIERVPVEIAVAWNSNSAPSASRNVPSPT